MHALDVGRLLFGTVAVFCFVLVPGCNDPEPVDGTIIRERIDELSTYLDSDEYAEEVSWSEHIVLTYQAVADRLPTLSEFLVINGLKAHPGLDRSDLLALVLARDALGISWDACRGFTERKNTEDFRSTSETLAAAAELDETPVERVRGELEFTSQEMLRSIGAFEEVPETTGPVDVDYTAYFGYLHAHSHFSLDADQAGRAEEAYEFARRRGAMDFFSLTDHGIFLVVWPWQKKWERTREIADSANAPGEFVALWGFEYSNPLLGHISILNTEDFTHTLRAIRLTTLYDWLALRPHAIAQFNHPGDYDYLGIEFLDFRLHRKASPMVMGIETWNTNHDFDDYFYRGVSIEAPNSPLDFALRQGWVVGALGAQDNHDPDWGTKNDFRTGVLAKELTREAIIEAFRERRFYATEDKDLRLDFRCSGYPMGARLRNVARTFTVSIADGSGDTFQEVRLYRNGTLLDRAVVGGTAASVAFEDAAETGDDYYYVMVTQNDDNNGDGRKDEALSSPIWIRE